MSHESNTFSMPEFTTNILTRHIASPKHTGFCKASCSACNLMAHLHMIFMDNLCVIGQKDIAGFVFPSLASTVTFRSEATCFKIIKKNTFIMLMMSLLVLPGCAMVCVWGEGGMGCVCVMLFSYTNKINNLDSYHECKTSLHFLLIHKSFIFLFLFSISLVCISLIMIKETY